MSEQFKVLDLFSGIGGFSLGLERTGGFKTVAFCEIDNYCQRVLHKHWPEVYIHSDIRTLTAKHFDGWTRPDVICGGFPCQDISAAGKRVGIGGERSGLWKEYLRIIQEVAPRYAIIENVAALLSNGMDVVLRDLSESGYDAEWQVISAADVGAAHLRERVWIVAYPASDLRGASGDEGYEPADGRCPLLAHTESLRMEEQRLPTEGGVFVADFNGSRKDVAHSDGAGFQGWEIQSERTGEWSVGTGGLGYSKGERCQRGGNAWAWGHGLTNSGQPNPLSEFIEGREIERDFCGVAYGVSNRVHRLKALGNSIVPQIATWIGQRILEAESEVARNK